MKQDIASPLSGTYKAVNSSLVYTIAEGCSLVVREFSRESTRNKPLKSDFPACKLSDFLENSRAISILPDTQQVTTLKYSGCLLSERSIKYCTVFICCPNILKHKIYASQKRTFSKLYNDILNS